MWSACHKKSYLTNLEVRNLKSEISCLCPVWLSQFCLFWKKMGKGFVNIPKFVNSTHNKYLFLWHADHIKKMMYKLKFQEFQAPGTMSIHKITWSTFNLGYNWNGPQSHLGPWSFWTPRKSSYLILYFWPRNSIIHLNILYTHFWTPPTPYGVIL